MGIGLLFVRQNQPPDGQVLAWTGRQEQGPEGWEEQLSACVADEHGTQRWTTLNNELSDLTGNGKQYDWFENEAFLVA